MANLFLAIPYSTQAFVIKEVYRVLDVGGRVELIDDLPIFPYGQQPPPKSDISTKNPRMSDSSFFDLDSDSDSDSVESDESYHSNSSAPTSEHYTPSTSPEKDSSLSLSSDQSRPTPEMTVHCDWEDLPISTPPPTWAQQAENSRALETIFENMLERKGIILGVYSFGDILQQQFGKRHACREFSFHLKLSPSDPARIHGYEAETERDIRGRHGRLWGKKDLPSTPEEPSAIDTTVPQGISAKAATKLGITYTALAEASAAATANRSPAKSSSSLRSHDSALSSPRQSLGLVVWPSTFIPLMPAELEMHSCKHLHMLLGCRSALSDFVDENNRPLIDQVSLTDALWDYEW
jgi:hypothetical protein